MVRAPADRVSGMPNQRVQALTRIAAATQRRLPAATPSHMPKAHPANAVTAGERGGVARQRGGEGFPTPGVIPRDHGDGQSDDHEADGMA